MGEFEHLFSRSDLDVGHVTLVKHTIPTGDAEPIQLQPYRHEHTYEGYIRDFIRELKQRRLIEDSDGRYSFPLVIVRKKDGTPRCCVDYRLLNAQTEIHRWPFPTIQNLIDQLRGAQYFSTLDCCAGYYNIEIEEKDRPKTSFICREGVFQWIRAPMGLAGIPFTFQRVVETMMRDIFFDVVLVYLDDFIVKSSTFDQHLADLREVFRRLAKTGFKFKLKKCAFGKSKLTYLGHIIGRNGVKADPDKIRAIIEFPQPSTRKELQRFLGLMNWISKFIPNAAVKAAPLFDLVQKKAKVDRDWCAVHAKAFTEIKEAAGEALTLAYADFNNEFKVYTDASIVGIGTILSQEDSGIERPIMCASMKFKKHELNWTTVEQECYAVIFACEVFRYYLLGAKFTIYTDCSALQWLMDGKHTSRKLMRWKILLSEFDGKDKMKIVHRPGKLQVHVDSLSRAPLDNSIHNTKAKEMEDYFIGALLSAPHLPEDISVDQMSEAQRNDAELAPMINYKLYGILPEDVKDARKVAAFESQYLYDKKRQLLYHLYPFPLHRRNDLYHQLVIPSKFKQKALETAHNSLFGGHQGINRTYYLLQCRFYWENMYEDAKKWVIECQVCDARRKPYRMTKAELEPLPITQPMWRM